MRKSCIDRELTMELIVGTFMLMVLLGMGYFTIVLSRQKLFREEYELQVRFAQVMGLRGGDDVVVRGMAVGKVREIVFDEGGGVRVICATDQPVRLREDYRITIVMTSILGGRQLSVFEGSPGARPWTGGDVAEGETPIDLVDETATMIRDVRAALGEGGVLDNLRRGAADLAALTGKLRRGEGTVGKLLNEDALYASLETTVSNLQVVSRGLAEGRGLAGKLLRDEALYDEIKTVAGNLKEISQRLADGKGTAGRLLSEDDRLYRDLAESVAGLKAVIQNVQAGKGSLGRLVSDDELYREARDLLNDLQAAVDDFRENTPVVTFTSLLFGAL